MAALSACAIFGQGASGNPESEVTERSRQWWELVRTGNLDKAYEYLSPASQSVVPKDVFRKRNKAGQWWRTMAVEKVDCRPEACQVTITFEYDLFELKGLKRKVQEDWIKDAGTWWLVAGAK